MNTAFAIDWETKPDPTLQARFEAIESPLAAQYGIAPELRGAGLLDLKTSRLAMVRPDWMTYGASVPKIGILLAYFQLRPEAVIGLDPTRKRELGEMIKISSNEMAAKYSQDLGLKPIQEVLCSMGFYDKSHGGGVWVGKHYGVTGERIGDPLADLSHAATVRQLLRFYLLLEQEALISAPASRTMRRIFESPELRHEPNKFLQHLRASNGEVIRKSGSWENWLHDTMVVKTPNRHYALAALTEHPKGDDYLADLGRAVDDLMSR